MNEYSIKPSTVQKPIQLLAAWLVGLIATNTLFLASATKIHDPKWIVPTLVIAAIIYVPIFLFCIFLLQTKYRPEMQEDPYYADYLKSLRPNTPSPPPPVDLEATAKRAEHDNKKLADTLKEFQLTLLAAIFKSHRVIAEMYSGTDWPAFYKQWEKNDGLTAELAIAVNANLVDYNPSKSIFELTDLGREVCTRLQKNGDLYKVEKK